MYLPKETWLEVVRNYLLVSIDLIVRDPQGCVLVGMRKNRPAQGCWFVPGGCVHKDETLPGAFRRLTQDELGTSLEMAEANQFYGLYEHIYQDNFAGEQGVGTHYIVLAYEIRLNGGLETLPEDQHSGYRWMTVEELLADPTVHANTKNYFNENREQVEYARRFTGS